MCPAASAKAGGCWRGSSRRAFLKSTGLTCSIGVAPNRLLAKMASEFNKPNGISIVYEEDLQATIWPLNVRKINGIGPKAGEKLAALGMHTIGELAAQDPQWLMGHFGKSTGAWMHRVAWGRDDSPVVTESEPVSMSRETTFERDLHAVRDRAELGRIFTDLCQRVAQDLQRKGYVGKTIGIKLRYDDFKTPRATTPLPGPRRMPPPSAARRGCASSACRWTERLRLLGVRVGALVRLSDHLASAGEPPCAGPGTARHPDPHTVPLF
jgi:DNA polymerase-4